MHSLRRPGRLRTHPPSRIWDLRIPSSVCRWVGDTPRGRSAKVEVARKMVFFYHTSLCATSRCSPPPTKRIANAGVIQIMTLSFGTLERRYFCGQGSSCSNQPLVASRARDRPILYHGTHMSPCGVPGLRGAFAVVLLPCMADCTHRPHGRLAQPGAAPPQMHHPRRRPDKQPPVAMLLQTGGPVFASAFSPEATHITSSCPSCTLQPDTHGCALRARGGGEWFWVVARGA
jgi:hypothetical protein